MKTKGEETLRRALRRARAKSKIVKMPEATSGFEAWLGYRVDCLEKKVDRIYWLLIAAFLANIGLRVLGVL